MTHRPPRPTPPDTLVPYTTRFRSPHRHHPVAPLHLHAISRIRSMVGKALAIALDCRRTVVYDAEVVIEHQHRGHPGLTRHRIRTLGNLLQIDKIHRDRKSVG